MKKDPTAAKNLKDGKKPFNITTQKNGSRKKRLFTLREDEGSAAVATYEDDDQPYLLLANGDFIAAPPILKTSPDIMRNSGQFQTVKRPPRHSKINASMQLEPSRSSVDGNPIGVLRMPTNRSLDPLKGNARGQYDLRDTNSSNGASDATDLVDKQIRRAIPTTDIEDPDYIMNELEETPSRAYENSKSSVGRNIENLRVSKTQRKDH